MDDLPLLEPTELYRHFNSRGRLLYVGISLSTLTRLAQHRRNASWFDEIATITVEHYPCREIALTMEKLAIENEDPLYNKMMAAPDQEGRVTQYHIDSVEKSLDEMAEYAVAHERFEQRALDSVRIFEKLKALRERR